MRPGSDKVMFRAKRSQWGVETTLDHRTWLTTRATGQVPSNDQLYSNCSSRKQHHNPCVSSQRAHRLPIRCRADSNAHFTNLETYSRHHKFLCTLQRPHKGPAPARSSAMVSTKLHTIRKAACRSRRRSCNQCALQMKADGDVHIESAAVS
jgi:hypothetical protein